MRAVRYFLYLCSAKTTNIAESQKNTMEHEKWQWQEPGAAWRGAALYHITLTVSNRQPVLGRLMVPGDDPSKAWLQRTALGDAVVDCLLGTPQYHPEVRVLHFCLMPDHLHAVIYVRRTMANGIKTVTRGFWQGVKKLGRASTCSGTSFLIPSSTREELKDATARLKTMAAGLCQQLGNDAYYALEPLFSEMPFIRAMGRYSQLATTIRYLDMNPQRLATKRLMPGFFRVQKAIEVAGRSYDGVGNVALLHAERYHAVHVRSMWVKDAERGESQTLRDYMNGCVLEARKGTVMVSPFISPQEKQVMQVLLNEQRSFIVLADNGFRDYYKPVDALFDACAAGRVLILSPWSYVSTKRHISRSDCVALNAMAEEICSLTSLGESEQLGESVKKNG